MEKGINKVVVSAHVTASGRTQHMLGRLRDEGVIVIDETPVETGYQGPFAPPSIPIINYAPIHDIGTKGPTEAEKLERTIIRHLYATRSTLPEEAELIRQKQSTLPSAARKYLMDVMYKPTHR
jgi:hypothetical protein